MITHIKFLILTTVKQPYFAGIKFCDLMAFDCSAGIYYHDCQGEYKINTKTVIIIFESYSTYCPTREKVTTSNHYNLRQFVCKTCDTTGNQTQDLWLTVPTLYP